MRFRQHLGLFRLCAICICSQFALVYACSWDNPVWPKSARSDTSLFRFEVGADSAVRAGYIDSNGKVIIPPIFETQGNYGYDDFFDGIALVHIDGKEWYINTKGEKLFRGRDSGPFSEGLAAFEESGKTGFLNRQGHVSILPTFDSAGPFSDGLAAAQVGGKYGYVDLTGTFVIQPSFMLALPFSGGVARVIKRRGCLYIGYGPCDSFNPLLLPFALGKYQQPTMQEPHCTYSFIDKVGRDLFATTYRDAKDFVEGLAPVGDGKRWGYVNASGSLAVPLLYQNAEPFSDGLAAVQTKGRWGYVNHAGNLIIKATFLAAFPFSEGVALTMDTDSQYRFIDKTGLQAIPGSFTIASSFAMGRAHVRNGINYNAASWAYIDHSGRVVFRYTAQGEGRR